MGTNVATLWGRDMDTRLKNYILVTETATCYIFEALDGSHELWVKKENSNETN